MGGCGTTTGGSLKLTYSCRFKGARRWVFFVFFSVSRGKFFSTQQPGTSWPAWCRNTSHCRGKAVAHLILAPPPFSPPLPLCSPLPRSSSPSFPRYPCVYVASVRLARVQWADVLCVPVSLYCEGGGVSSFFFLPRVAFHPLPSLPLTPPPPPPPPPS